MIHARSGTLGLVLLIAGCATAPVTVAPAPASVQVNAPMERVWNATLTVFTDANIPIENMEKASGFIRSGEMTAKGNTQIGNHRVGDIIDCGKEIGIAHTTTGTTILSFTVLMQPQAENATSLRVRGSARNFDTTALGDKNKQCVSRGVFENYIAQRIAEQAALGAPAAR